MKKIFKNIGITLITLLLIITSSIAKDLMVSADATPPRTDGEQYINANNLEWEKVSTEFPLGGATDFNAFFFDFLKDFNESGGPMAARSFENVKIVTFEEGSKWGINQFLDYAIPKFNVSILALNSILMDSGTTLLYNGDAIIGDNVSEAEFGFNTLKVGSIFRMQEKIEQYFKDAQVDLLKQNNSIWSLKDNKEVLSLNDGYSLTLKPDAGQNVYSLDSTQVNSGKTVNIVFNPTEHPEAIVIKVDASQIRLGDFSVNGKAIANSHEAVLNRILWVFNPEVKNIEIQRTGIMGSVLAPNADLVLTEGYSAVNGTIVANSLTATGVANGSEFHYIGRFGGRIKTPDAPVVETTSVSVNKVWVGEAKESVTVNLLGDGTPVGSIVLNAANEWKHTFTNLPLLDGTGMTIVYSVSEEKVLGYTSAITGTNNDFTITNTQDVIEKTSIPVHKVWVGEGTDWHKPVTINLYLNDVFVQELILNEANQWAGSFDNLDKVEGYTIKEVSGDGFKSNITGNATDGFTVTNTRYEEKDITVNKVFIGDSKLDAINFDLLADKVVIQTITLNDLNNWTHSFEKLPVFNELGNRIEYSVIEHEVSGFNSEVTVNNSGFTITNTPTGTLDIPVSKVWVGKEGSEAIVVLSRSNSTETVEVSLNAANNWEHVFKDLPAFDANCIKIMYSVSEKTIPGYGSDVSGRVENGFVFTNTFVPETHKIPVSKVWIGDALSEITVELLLGEDVIQTLTLNAANNWTALFDEVPKTDIYGVDLEYSVREVLADGYKTVIQGNDDQGFIITNTRYEETSIAVTKKWLGESSVETITVKVLADGEVIASEDITAAKDWKHTFEKLPVYNSKGQKISYTVEEVAVAGFETTIAETTNGNFEITNKRTGVTSVDVSKVWVGKVDDSVIIDLYANDALIDSITLNAKNNWAHSFKDLNAFDDLGLPINYDVKERLDNTYTSSRTGSHEDGYVFTNTYVIEKTKIPVTKTWVNVDDSTILPDAVYIDLYRNGEKTDQTLTLNKANLWQASFDNLDKTDAMGIAYIYTVKEQIVAGFTSNVIENLDGSFTVQNRRQAITEVSVEKQWIGKAKDSATINLLADGVEVSSIVLNKDNALKHTFKDLEAFTKEGKAIIYTVEEPAMEGYQTRIMGDAQSGFVIVNAYQSAIRESINFEKVWVDGPVEHPEIEIQLLRNKVVIDTITLINGDTSHSWTNLPKEDIHGKEYVYSVKEVIVPDGYESVGSGNVDEGFVITNTFKVALTDLTVTKTWINGPNVKPNIQVQLLRDGMAFGEVVTLNHPNVTYTWKDLDATDAKGNDYVYSVKELNVDGYESVVNGFEITNTFIVETTEFKVDKVWVGGPELRPEVQVQLFQDGVAFQAPVVLDETMTHTWTDLPKTDLKGKLHEYTVDEVAVPSSYVKTVNGSVITNTYIIEKTDVTVTKVWVNAPAERPDVQIQLLRNGETFGSPVTLTHPITSHTWTDLDKTNLSGTDYVYTVVEVDVSDDYVSSVEGLTITNSYQVKTKDLAVNKVWVGPKTDAVEFSLFKDGELLETVVLNDANNWHYEFKDLAMTDLSGKEIVYTVVEEVLKNYESDVVVNSDGSITITNTFIEIPEVPEVPEVPEKPKEEVPTLPATGIQSNLPIGMSMIAVGFVFVMRVLRRKESN